MSAAVWPIVPQIYNFVHSLSILKIMLVNSLSISKLVLVEEYYACVQNIQNADKLESSGECGKILHGSVQVSHSCLFIAMLFALQHKIM